MVSPFLLHIVNQDGDQQVNLLFCNMSYAFNLPCIGSQRNALTIVGTHAFQFIWEGSITNREVSSVAMGRSK